MCAQSLFQVAFTLDQWNSAEPCCKECTPPSLVFGSSGDSVQKAAATLVEPMSVQDNVIDLSDDDDLPIQALLHSKQGLTRLCAFTSVCLRTVLAGCICIGLPDCSRLLYII
jgi:hypothetical protein